mmetsp:Transcript_142024/g.441615  ORF Transcript_142024/g.441615 Transcript_142024/m.441615 type:complete len:264 (-) Transcript_142024:257-1048(-)
MATLAMPGGSCTQLPHACRPGAGSEGGPTGNIKFIWFTHSWCTKKQRSNSHHEPYGDGKHERTTPTRSTMPFLRKTKRPRGSKCWTSCPHPGVTGLQRPTSQEGTLCTASSVCTARCNRGRTRNLEESALLHHSGVSAPWTSACKTRTAAAEMPPHKRVSRRRLGQREAIRARLTSEGPPRPRRCSSSTSCSKPACVQARSSMSGTPNGSERAVTRPGIASNKRRTSVTSEVLRSCPYGLLSASTDLSVAKSSGVTHRCLPAS